MKIIPYLLILVPLYLSGQGSQDVLSGLPNGALPEKLLSTRSFVITSSNLSPKEMDEIHKSLMRTGIDVVGYFEIDRVFAGSDVVLAFDKYFQNREIANLIFIRKKEASSEILVTPFGDSKKVLDAGQSAWKIEDPVLAEALRALYRTALSSYKKQNLLINEIPETNLTVNIISGKRNETFAYDLKVDALAVPKFGNETMDRELAEIMNQYPFKYQLVDPALPEPELRKQGMFYILRFVNTRGPVAKQLLGFDVSKAESALVSVTYPNGQEQVKTIPSDVPIYKFYARQIEYNNVFLGNKWDADTTWQQALKNFIKGLRNEMRIN